MPSRTRQSGEGGRREGENQAAARLIAPAVSVQPQCANEVRGPSRRASRTSHLHPLCVCAESPHRTTRL